MSTPVHKTLARQLRRHLGAGDAELAADPSLRAFVAAVSASYVEAEAARAQLARSLETMSAELLERYDRLRESAEAYRLLFARSPIPMWVHAPATRRLLAVNDAMAAHYGYSSAEFAAMRLDDLHAPGDRAACAAMVAEAAGRARYLAEVTHVTRDGAALRMELTGHAVTWEGAAAQLVLAVDVTERRRMEAELHRQAFHDELTGLPNRALFRDRVEHALTRGARQRVPLTALFLDLDGFKKVNDSLGHAAGDALLRQVGERLLAVVRGGDTVARLGGDEFAILLDSVVSGEEPGGAPVAERILAALSAPVCVGDREVAVGTSIGIATARPGGDADELLRDADAAMYAAKAAGRGRWARFDAEMHRRAVERLDLETDLAHAVERGQLRVVYQPLCDLDTGRPYGVEALVRWEHPGRGLVAPAEFIAVAEETGLIGAIGRWVLREACAQMRAWNDRRAPGHAPLVLNVNVSGRQLDDERFVDDVRDALAATGLDPACLTLEITESAIMRDVEATLVRLHALKALGVRLAVDDFGTGYSSLAYLQRFPVDQLKIDKSFVDAVAHAPGAASLVRTIVALGQSLRLGLVAEGIEHAEQRAALRALGCTSGQGYLLARPASADAVAALLLPEVAAAAA